MDLTHPRRSSLIKTRSEMTIMTAGQDLYDLYALTTGDAELHHALDPLDYDGCPLQRMALGYTAGPTTKAAETPLEAASGPLTT